MLDANSSLTEVRLPDVRHPRRQTLVPLLDSELTAPALPVEFTPRPRLATLLDDAAGGPLTVVVAPAGWGKTTLLSSWVRDIEPGPVAWMTVERGDDADRFWRYLHASLGATVLTAAENQQMPPGPGAVPRRDYLTRLANALACRTTPAVLTIDDFHHVDDPSVASDLDFLLRHAAATLRLVLASRTRPELALHRWRLTGELTAVTADELAFTVPETAQLLACHGIELPEATVGTVRDRTEGWAAGLRLMALEIRGSPDPAAGLLQAKGDQPAIAEYLWREVLADEPADVRQVLLLTSVSGRLHGGLVNALADRTDGERILAELAERNLFTVAIPGRPGWYRHHALLGEVLRSRAQRQIPEWLPKLHCRAASWHAAQGLGRTALWHALAARDCARATDVLFDQWPSIAICQSCDTAGTTVPPPAPDTVAAPEVALAYAADRLSDDDGAGADRYLRLAEAHRKRVAPDHRNRFEVILIALRLARARLCPDPAAAIPLARRLLTLGPVSARAADEPDLDLRTRAVALASLGTAHLHCGHLGPAEAALSDGMDAADQAYLPCARLACAARLALLRAAKGDLRSAEEAARATLLAQSCPAGCDRDRRACAHLALALVQYEREQLTDAARYLDLAAGTCHPAADPFLLAEIATARTRLLQAQHDLPGAYEVVRAAQRDLAGTTGPYAADRLILAEAEVRVDWGDTATVRAMLTPLVEDANPSSAEFAVPLARAYLRDGDPATASRVLPCWNDERAAEPLSMRLETGLLQAVAAHRTGDSHRAERSMERVLALAEPEGFRHLFTRGGSPVRALLAHQLDAGTAYWSWARELLGVSGRTATSDNERALVEPLSDRELTVLRYLQGTLSNLEIASELSISVNTVKSHVRSVYRKLAVMHRRDAVRKARDLCLL
jgi:LuxR family transcriptional regulator, maltose regulon positive regulatory protein